MQIHSPLAERVPAIKEKSISKSFLIKEYSARFGIDVTNYFPTGSNVSLYRCPETGYQFFYPFTCSGSSEFYEHFQKFDWYYMPWKWEHQMVCRYVTRGMNVLEVGCGSGSFIKKIQEEKGVKAVGLELNKDAITNGQKTGIDIRNETIQEHKEFNPETYDIVCSFEVLEHIGEVKTFIQGKVDALKKGGLLAIAVPNNDSFIKLTFKKNILNQPPHHMGLWNKRSLQSLTRLFPLRVKHFFFEPLQEYHQQAHKEAIELYYHSILKRKFLSFFNYLPLFIKLRIQKIALKTLQRYFKNGQTILVIYEKL